mmetsp:Transcript_14624/g.37915  ORF Transcript_14624/g.37915 Transcript_14624/m.37915 type:complete len:239 (-) Transcript_14624:577-1293(-)
MRSELGAGRAWLGIRQHLAGVHQIERVQRGLDGLLAADVHLPVLRAHVRHLAHPHAVLARHGAAQAERQLDHLVLQLLAVLLLLRLVRHAAVEVAVRDVAAHHAREAAAREDRLRLGHALRQPRQRHAHVRQQHAVAAFSLPVHAGRDVAAPARIPETIQRVAILRKAGRARAVRARQRRDLRPLLGQRRFVGGRVADELEEKRGGGREGGIEHGVGGAHPLRVEHLALKQRWRQRPH